MRQMMLAFAVARIPAFCDDGALAVVFAALLLFGAAALPLAYALSFAFSNEMNALAGQMALAFFAGGAQLVAAAVLRGLAALGTARRTWAALRALFRWLPHYNVGAILVNLAHNAALPAPARASPWDVAADELAALSVEAVLFTALTLALEFDAAGAAQRATRHIRAAARTLRGGAEEEDAATAPAALGGGGEKEDDAGVLAERARIVASGGDAGDVLTLRALRKTYEGRGGGARAAVSPLTCGVPQGRCFGLLGVNGAGKSTVFKMLTGAVAPSGGDALVRDGGSSGDAAAFNVVSQRPAVRQRVGLCAQDDGLAERLTSREHLLFYAAVRGVPAADASRLADELLGRLGLTRCADRLAGTLSGGNQRKLSVAIALVGAPPLLLLDEPSTGMVRVRAYLLCMSDSLC
jgi:ABC-type Na+ transport system ATPase subunit NatA